jgi:hypothetical protein
VGTDYRVNMGTTLRAMPSGRSCLTCGREVSRAQYLGASGLCYTCGIKATLKGGAK